MVASTDRGHPSLGLRVAIEGRTDLVMSVSSGRVSNNLGPGCLRVGYGVLVEALFRSLGESSSSVG